MVEIMFVKLLKMIIMFQMRMLFDNWQSTLRSDGVGLPCFCWGSCKPPPPPSCFINMLLVYRPVGEYTNTLHTQRCSANLDVY